MQKVTETTYPNIVCENAKVSPEYNEAAQTMSQQMIKEFLELCKIPHPSGHTEEMKNHILNKGADYGVKTFVKDDAYICMDIEASAGMKEAPKTILQCHYDMVAVAPRKNKDFDPVTSIINAVYDKETGRIHTNQTSTLGADDGFGVSTLLAFAALEKKLDLKHGPIRLIITNDEETSMVGASKMTKKDLDAKYLVNLDSTYVGQIIPSAAGGLSCTINHHFEPVQASNDALQINLDIWGLRGGHSGVDIHRNRISTSEFIKDLLKKLNDENLTIQILALNAGSVANAIPANAKIKLVIDSKDKTQAEQAIKELIEDYIDTHSDGNSLQSKIEFLPADGLKVLSANDSLLIMQFLSILPFGVIEQRSDGSTKTSNNVGVIKLNEGKFFCKILYRSNDQSTLDEAYDKVKVASQEGGFDFSSEDVFPVWQLSEKDTLINLAKEAFNKTAEIEPIITELHAGLEGGYFSKLNPDMELISLGCDVQDEHTWKETLHTKSMPVYCAALIYILSNIN